MPRHREVDVTGELDEAIDEVELASQPRDVPRGAGRVAGVHPLRGEGEVEVPAGNEARPLEGLTERPVGRAGVGRRLEDDELAGPEAAPDRLRGAQDGAEVGILRVRD